MQHENDDRPANIILYINNLAAHQMDDFTGNDELVLVYAVNSYRESGTIYATSVGTFHTKEVTPESVREIKQLVSVPTVEDGHISASFGLVEVDSEETEYKLAGQEGKVYYNEKDFTFFNRYMPEEDFYGTAAKSSWGIIEDAFKLIGVDIKEHLEISLLDANDNLGAYRIDLRNEDMPERASRNEIYFGGSFNNSNYSLTFYLNKNQSTPSPGVVKEKSDSATKG